jgi:hypothetical protein
VKIGESKVVQGCRSGLGERLKPPRLYKMEGSSDEMEETQDN